MKILDRYILRKFLTSWVFVVLLLISVVVVIDITEKNDKFIKAGLTLEDILPYYLAFIPWLANLITPITVFIAVIFVTSKLAGHTEIIATLAAGVSFKRFMVPYLIGAIIIAVFSFTMNGWVIPHSNKTRVAFEIEHLKKPFNYAERDIHMKIDRKSYMYLETYNNSSDVGYRFTLETIDGNQMLEKFEAKRLEWQDSTGKWVAKDWTNRRFDGEKEIFSQGAAKDTALQITPEDFASTHNRNETLDMGELSTYIRKLEERGADDVQIYKIEKYIRYMAPFTVLILTFIALIVSSRKTRGGSGFQIALGFLIAFIFIIFFIMSRAIAEAGSMPPLLAVWLPNIVFGSIGIILYRTVPR